MNIGYSYDDLLRQLPAFPSVFAVGRSVFGRTLWCIRVGQGPAVALIHAAIHAREHITAPVVVAMAAAYRHAYRKAMPCIDFVPMVNPDGVQLCLYGVKSAPRAYRTALLAANRNNPDFSLWKANGQGVDLNTDFDADWGHGAGNVFVPSPQGYVGVAPNSAPEVKALVRLTRRQGYIYTLSYHCKGEIVYYGYGTGLARHHSRHAAIALADYLHYTPLTSVGSCGGYKDWYALHYPDGVALTVEVGDDRYAHPFPYTQLEGLIRLHRGVPLHVARRIQERE